MSYMHESAEVAAKTLCPFSVTFWCRGIIYIRGHYRRKDNLVGDSGCPQVNHGTSKRRRTCSDSHPEYAPVGSPPLPELLLGHVSQKQIPWQRSFLRPLTTQIIL